MYKIKIKNTLLKNNQVTSLHIMVALIFIILGALAIAVPGRFAPEADVYIKTIGAVILITGISLIVVTMFFNKKIIQTKYNKIIRYIELTLLIGLMIYTLKNQWYLPFAYVLSTLLGIVFAILWEKYAEKDHYINITEEDIIIPGFFKNKHLAWSEIGRVLLKHGLITIDCRNNKLYQFPALEHSGTKEEIERFSKERIEAEKGNYDANWE